VKIKEIEIENILSIEKLKLTIQDSGLVLIEGWNHDANRANGAGKTAIFNAMSYGLFGKLPRKVTASEILRRGSKSGWVRVVVTCGQETWTVTRSRPNGCTYFNGQVQASITQEEWEAILRLNYDQFLMSMYCSQYTGVTTQPRFLLTPDTDKKKFLLQLLGLNVFSEVKKVTDLKIKELEGSLSEFKSKQEVIDSKIDVYSESLIDTNVYDYHIKLALSELQVLNDEINTLREIERPDLSALAKIETDINTKQMEFASTKTKRTMLHSNYRSLELELSEYDPDMKCNECGSLKDNDEARAAHVIHQTGVKYKLKAIKKDIDDCDLILLREESIKNLSVKLKERKQSETRSYEKAHNRILELRSAVNNKTKDLNGLRLKLEEDSELHSKIKVLVSNRNKYLDACKTFTADLELHKTIANLYSPTGAQAYILDSVIDFFNEAVDKHVDMMWPNASYTLTSYKENVKGDITAKFSEILTMDGKEVSVGSLSGGELKALSLCVDFSILDILETQFGIALNPIILDEPFEGLDPAGREIVVELLEKLSQTRQIFVIDHATEAKAMFSQVIRVEKRSGVTTMVIDPS
jgi:DNA repair exonuclease SbcCD ATPase subunit